MRSLEPLHGCRYKALRHLQNWIQNLLSENPKRSDPPLFGFFVLDDPPTQAVPLISLPGGLAGVPSFWDFGSPCFRGFGVFPPQKSHRKQPGSEHIFTSKNRAIFNQHWKRFSHLPEFRNFFRPGYSGFLSSLFFFGTKVFWPGRALIHMKKRIGHWGSHCSWIYGGSTPHPKMESEDLVGDHRT